MISIIASLFADKQSPYLFPTDFKRGSIKRIQYQSMASARLNLLPLVDAILSKKVDAKIWNVQSESFAIDEILKSKKIIILKLGHTLKPKTHAFKNISAIIDIAEEKSKQIILYYGDNYTCKNDDMSTAYKALLRHASTIISHSDYLLDICKNFNHAAELVRIPDPCLLKKQSFDKLKQNSTCKIIWFGQGANLKYLLLVLPEVITKCDTSRKYELSILTHNEDLQKKIIPTINRIIEHYATNQIVLNWKFKIVPWNYQDQPLQLERELKNAHISLIPSDPTNPWKAGASSNRLVDSIQSGCIAIASRLKSYDKLKMISLQGENFPELIDIAWENRIKLAIAFSNQREKYLHEYSICSVKNRWTALFTEE